jgi:hypothetical protein
MPDLLLQLATCPDTTTLLLLLLLLPPPGLQAAV